MWPGVVILEEWNLRKTNERLQPMIFIVVKFKVKPDWSERWLGLVNDYFSAHYFRIVQCCYRCLRFSIVFHFHKTKTLTSAGYLVLHDFC